MASAGTAHPVEAGVTGYDRSPLSPSARAGTAMSNVSLRTAGGALLLCMTFLLSVFLVRAQGTPDVLIWLKWMSIVHDEGIVAGYATIVANFPKTVMESPAYINGGGEYPPLAYAILYAAGRIGEMVGLTPFQSLKATLFLFHWAAVIVVLAASRSLLLAAAFSAATLLFGVALGYLDTLFAAVLIAAFWALASGRNLLAVALLIVSVMIKWQPLIIAPFVAAYLFDMSSLEAARDSFRRGLFRWVLAFGAVTVLVLALLFGSTTAVALKHATSHHFLSGLAMNLPWLEGYVLKVLFHPTFTAGSEMTPPVPPALLQLPIKLMFWAVFVAVFVMAARSERTLRNCLLFSLLGSLTYCTLNTGVHENHWTLPLFLSFCLLIHDRSEASGMICLLVAAVANVNPFFFYGVTGQPVQPPVLGIDLSIPFAVLCVSIWLALALYVWKATERRGVARWAGRIGAPLGNRA
jgi:hypothetical protein